MSTYKSAETASLEKGLADLHNSGQQSVASDDPSVPAFEYTAEEEQRVLRKGVTCRRPPIGPIAG